jgi:cytochrome c oxidase cbb3-type subunit 4
MDIDINTVRGVLTLLLLLCFAWLCIWAYSRKQVASFNEAANLPFADEHLSQRSGIAAANSRHNGEPS